LRDRRGDVPLLARFFTAKYNERYKREAKLTDSGLKRWKNAPGRNILNCNI